MSASQTMRPKYFEGQYLGADDLTAAVEYGRIQDARHALGAHTWGIAIGLQLKEVEQPDKSIQVFIQPGYAWDGFGRPIVILSPFSLPGDLFKSISTADDAEGKLVEVWVRYREVKTRQPDEGFGRCQNGDQNSRIQETFTVEVGERRNLSDQRDDITVSGTPVPATDVFQAFDSTDPVIYDASVPQQAFPEPGSRAKWLIFLGYVRWKPAAAAGQPGTFGKTSEADRTAANVLRVPIGAVAGAIQAPEGVLRLKDRTKDLSPTRSDDLVWVEGDLRVEGSARLFGHSLDFLDNRGNDNGVPLSMSRAGDGQSGGRQLRIEIGSEKDGENSLQIGPNLNNTYTPRVTVLDNGNVGIATTNPAEMVEIKGGNLLLKATQEDAGDVVFQNSAGVQKGRIWSKPAAGAGLYMSSADDTPDLAIDSAGQIGIGTISPNRAVTIEGAQGTYLNVRAGTGAQEVLLGADGNGAIVSAMTNHDLLLRAGQNSTKVTVKTDGKVGIGTTTPAQHLHVAGGRIRLEQEGRILDLRADGSAVDVQSDTNDLYVHAVGHNLLLNPHPSNGRVAVGLGTPACKLHVRDSISASAGEVASHVAVIENASTGDSADVLALQIGAGEAGSGNNFITFFAAGTPCGRIEGSGGQTVTYETSGADFAECLPRRAAAEPLEEGDVVGVIEGKVTRATGGAQHVSAITGRPAFVANARYCEAGAGHSRVAMMGQVPVKVRGPVRAGDLIVPSGLDDGIGVALSAEEAAARGISLVVGTAWESSQDQGVKRVNTAVGLHSTLLRAQQAEIERLRRRLRAPDGQS